MWNEIVKKIELQSILVLFVTLLFGFLLLNKDNNFSSPAGILGTISISVGLLYTIVSFFSNQIRENYKDVIAEYKSIVANVKSSSKHNLKQLKETMSDQGIGKIIGGSYQTISNQEIETEKE